MATTTAAATTRQPFPFDQVIITFPDENAATAANQGPVRALRSLYDGTTIIATTDPYGARVGSGGGTLAALSSLLIMSSSCLEDDDKEDHYLRQQQQQQQQRCRVLILHAGGESSRCPTQMVLGKAWTSLPCRRDNNNNNNHVTTPIALWLELCRHLFSSSSGQLLPAGSVVVVASDTLLQLWSNHNNNNHHHLSCLDWSSLPRHAVVGMAVPAVLETAQNHGVYVLPPPATTTRTTTATTTSSSSSSRYMESSRIAPCEAVWQKPNLDDLQRHCRPFLMPSSDDTSCGNDTSTNGTCTNGNSTNGSTANGTGTSTNGTSKNSDDKPPPLQYAWIDTGVVVFLPAAAAALYELATGALKACTAEGLQALYHQQQQHDDSDTATTTNGGSVSLTAFAKHAAIKVDLYTHILQALATTTTTDSSRTDWQQQEQQRQAYCSRHTSDFLSTETLQAIWNALAACELHIWTVPGGHFLHLGTTRELCDFLVQGSNGTDTFGATSSSPRRQLCQRFGRPLGLTKRLHVVTSTVADDDNHSGHEEQQQHLLLLLLPMDASAVVYHSILCVGRSTVRSCSSSRHHHRNGIGKGSVVEHCWIGTNDCLVIGRDCLVSGLRSCQVGSGRENRSSSSPQRVGPIHVPDGLMVQMLPLQKVQQQKSQELTTTTSQGDMTTTNSSNMDSSYVYMVLGMDDGIKSKDVLYGRPIQEFLAWAGLSESDLWGQGSQQSLWTARLHPVVTATSDTTTTATAVTDSSFASVFWWLVSFCQGSSTTSSTDPSYSPLAHDDELVAASLQKWKTSKRLSLSEIRNEADSLAEFVFREALAVQYIPALQLQQQCRDMHTILVNRQHTPVDLRHVVAGVVAAAAAAATNGGCGGGVHDLCQVLNELDRVFDECLGQSMYDVCGRACMIMSGLFYELDTFVQSGAIPDLAEAIEMTWHQVSKYRTVLTSLSKEQHDLPRTDIDDTPKPSVNAFGALMEQVAHTMTVKCVCPAASSGIDFSCNAEPIYDEWVIASAPARIDLAGGWSDTPPVCGEFGSAVTGAAVAIDGMTPLSCKCRLVTGAQGIALRSERRSIESGELLAHTDVVVTSLRDLVDLQRPDSDCALLQCALVCLGLTSLHEIYEGNGNTRDLQECINSFCKTQGIVRVEVVSTSLLPQGSGLGTSSILGGCILAAIGKCIGKDFLKANNNGNNKSHLAELIDGVLVLEQLLTTGGGFQDQVNGLVGGIKTVRCEPCQFPLQLSIEKINVTPAFQSAFNSRVVLGFTGKTRLAKNILRNVLNRWSKRTPEIVDTVQKLVAGAEQARQNVQEGDLDALAVTLNDYWELKKIMAGSDSGVDPSWIEAIVAELKRKQLIVGASLAGAGGGGFLALIMARGVTKETLRTTLETNGLLELTDDFCWHDCALCEQGLEVRTLAESGTMPIEHFDLNWLAAAHDKPK